MRSSKFLVVTILAIAIAASIANFAEDTTMPQNMSSSGIRIPFLRGASASQIDNPSELAALGRADAWLNSPPLTPSALRGKVVVIDFWTYTCINWRRTEPYVRAWGEKYRDQGLVVIGVHTPEFAFEKNLDNVRWAVKNMRIDYPIAVDSDYGVWQGFDNHYWPALYIIDAQGKLRYHYFGEGAYDQSETMIQKLLAEAGFPKGAEKPQVPYVPESMKKATQPVDPDRAA